MPDVDEPEEPLAELNDVETLLRELTASDTTLEQPPPDLWARIAAQTDGDDTSSPVVSITAARSRRRWALGALVAAATAAAVLGVASILSGDTEPLVVASAELTHDASAFDSLGADSTAQVALIDDGGTYRLDVTESDLPRPDVEGADLELWLIQPDADGNPAALVSLGLVDPTSPGVFDIPAGHDPGAYFVVDISIEPRDGDASHSGRSILRGPLVET